MKKENLVFLLIVIIALSLFGCFVYDREINYEWVTTQTKHIVVEKQIIKVSTNNFGAFREEYKLLLDNGELQDAELEEYMSFNKDDTITITNHYKERTND